MTSKLVKQIINNCGMPIDIAKAVAYQKKKSFEAGYEKAKEELVKTNQR